MNENPAPNSDQMAFGRFSVESKERRWNIFDCTNNACVEKGSYENLRAYFYDKKSFITENVGKKTMKRIIRKRLSRVDDCTRVMA